MKEVIIYYRVNELYGQLRVKGISRVDSIVKGIEMGKRIMEKGGEIIGIL